MRNEKLKIGAVSFINAYPLTKNLEFHNIIYDIPSVLADKLAKKELDVALISSVEYAKNFKEYRYISNLCISSMKKVDSILLFSKMDNLFDIKNLKYDISSRSSVAMLKIIFSKKNGFIPNFSSCDIGEIKDFMNSDNSVSNEIDAVLLIGDNALKYKDIQLSKNTGFNKIYDLGSEWYNIFGLPFVYALWVAREEIEIEESYLRNAYEKNKTHIKEILLESGHLTDFNFNYLTNTINYILTEDHIKSLDIFFKEAVKIGIIENDPHILNF